MTPDGRKLTESNNNWLSKEGSNKLILEWQGDEIVNNSNDQSGNPVDVPEGSSGPLGYEDQELGGEIIVYDHKDAASSLLGFYISSEYYQSYGEKSISAGRGDLILHKNLPEN